MNRLQIDSKNILEKTKFLLELKNKLITKDRNKLINSEVCYNQDKIIEFEDNFKAWVDEESGLMWEVKDKENSKNKYTYYDAQKYIEELNLKEYCGFNDWIIPKESKLEILKTKIPLSKNYNIYYYWSSTTASLDYWLPCELVFFGGEFCTWGASDSFYIRGVRENKISKKILIDYSWIDRLWNWADENNMPDWEAIEDESHPDGGFMNGLPRNKVKLLNFTELNLIHKQLKELPEEIEKLTHLKELNLYNNQFLKLPKEILKLYNLTGLYLWNNQLTELPKEIGRLTNLMVLGLRDNKLKEIPKELTDITNLTELYLGHNRLIKLPQEIGNLTNLTELLLRDNQLTELPNKIVNLTNLERLHLEKNSNLILTQEQKDWIENLQLQGCDVSIDDDLLERTIDDSWIERLWEWADENNICDLEWVEGEPYFYGNYWKGFPRNKMKLLNLTELHLYDNKLSELPKEIGNLSHLTEFYLYDNKLSELPKEIGNLSNLTKLYLWNNQLTELPREIENLTILTELDLAYNQLTELPKEIDNLTHLTELNLKGNLNLILTTKQEEWFENIYDEIPF